MATEVRAPGRLVVLAPNWLGDAVMALPLLSDLHRAWPATPHHGGGAPQRCPVVRDGAGGGRRADPRQSIGSRRSADLAQRHATTRRRASSMRRCCCRTRFGGVADVARAHSGALGLCARPAGTAADASDRGRRPRCIRPSITRRWPRAGYLARSTSRALDLDRQAIDVARSLLRDSGLSEGRPFRRHRAGRRLRTREAVAADTVC